MKTIAVCFVSSGLTIILMLFLLPIDPGERCETIVAQERAGWTEKIESLEGQVQHLKVERLAASVNAFSNQVKYLTVQRELAGRMAQDVVIPEPRPIKVSEFMVMGMNSGESVRYEADEIRALAKDATPVEQAARATNDTSWWKQLKAEHIKRGLARMIP